MSCVQGKKAGARCADHLRRRLTGRGGGGLGEGGRGSGGGGEGGSGGGGLSSFCVGKKGSERSEGDGNTAGESSKVERVPPKSEPRGSAQPVPACPPTTPPTHHTTPHHTHLTTPPHPTHPPHYTTPHTTHTPPAPCAPPAHRAVADALPLPGAAAAGHAVRGFHGTVVVCAWREGRTECEAQGMGQQGRGAHCAARCCVRQQSHRGSLPRLSRPAGAGAGAAAAAAEASTHHTASLPGRPCTATTRWCRRVYAPSRHSCSLYVGRSSFLPLPGFTRSVHLRPLLHTPHTPHGWPPLLPGPSPSPAYWHTEAPRRHRQAPKGQAPQVGAEGEVLRAGAEVGGQGRRAGFRGREV